MTTETSRKAYLEEIRNEYTNGQESVKSFDVKNKTIETKKEAEKVIDKIKTILGQINITLLQLWKNNQNLLKEINNLNNNDMHIFTWNLIWILRKYISDPGIISILNQLQFCMNTLTNQYKIKGEVDWISEAIKSIWDTVKIVYNPEKWWDSWNEKSFLGRSIYPTES